MRRIKIPKLFWLHIKVLINNCTCIIVLCERDWLPKNWLPKLTPRIKINCKTESTLCKPNSVALWWVKVYPQIVYNFKTGLPLADLIYEENHRGRSSADDDRIESGVGTFMNAKYVPVTVWEHSKTERTKLKIFP